MSNNVNKPEDKYEEYEPIWETCRDVMEGKRAVMNGGEKYLRKLNKMDDKEYENYKDSSAWFGASDRTKKALHGMLTEDEPTIDLPDAMSDYIEDATMAGISLVDLAGKSVDQILEVGRFGILADYQRKEDGNETKTVAQVEANNERPYTTTYKAEDIIETRQDYVNNKYQLVRVRLRESKEMESNNEFETEVRQRVRVLDLAPPPEQLDNPDYEGPLFYRVRIYEEINSSDMKSSAGSLQLIDTAYPVQRGERMQEIPFVVIGVTDILPDYEKPPLLDLIDLNVSYYRQDAQFARSLFLCCAPTMFFTGIDPDKEVYIGGDKAIVSDNADASAEFVEVTGSSLPIVAKRLISLVNLMAAMGARMLATENKQIEAALTHKIKREGEHSLLAQIGNNISSGLSISFDSRSRTLTS